VRDFSEDFSGFVEFIVPGSRVTAESVLSLLDWSGVTEKGYNCCGVGGVFICLSLDFVFAGAFCFGGVVWVLCGGFLFFFFYFPS